MKHLEIALGTVVPFLPTVIKSLKVKLLSCVRLFVTPWTGACHAPPSMGFPRQEHWSGLPFHTPEDLPDPEIEPASLVSPALPGRFFTTAPLI